MAYCAVCSSIERAGEVRCARRTRSLRPVRRWRTGLADSRTLFDVACAHSGCLEALAGTAECSTPAVASSARHVCGYFRGRPVPSELGWSWRSTTRAVACGCFGLLVTQHAQPIAGRKAIEQALTRFAALRPHMASNIRSVVSAGAVAAVINEWRLSGTASDGTPLTIGRHQCRRHGRRADDTWGF